MGRAAHCLATAPDSLLTGGAGGRRWATAPCGPQSQSTGIQPTDSTSFLPRGARPVTTQCQCMAIFACRPLHTVVDRCTPFQTICFISRLPKIPLVRVGGIGLQRLPPSSKKHRCFELDPLQSIHVACAKLLLASYCRFRTPFSGVFGSTHWSAIDALPEARRKALRRDASHRRRRTSRSRSSVVHSRLSTESKIKTTLLGNV
jgi:hypothetical protein